MTPRASAFSTWSSVIETEKEKAARLELWLLVHGRDAAEGLYVRAVQAKQRSGLVVRKKPRYTLHAVADAGLAGEERERHPEALA